jgi:hypothetical protein
VDNKELVEAFTAYGHHCKKLRNFLAAKQAFLNALSLDQSFPLVWSNLGAIYYELHEYDKAKECFEKAFELEPDHGSTCANYGLLLSCQNEWDQAHFYFDKAIEKAPDNLMVQWDKALTHLEAGDWEDGLKRYEVRHQHIAQEYPKYKFPLWDGEDLNDKCIIIYEEQGSGDKILFSRFIYQLKMKYPTCKIYFLCNALLQPLLWGYQKEKICEILPNGVIFPDDIDYGCWLMSLPRLLGCIDPLNVPPDPNFILHRCEFQKSTSQLTSLIPGGKKVGICWHGSTKHALDHQRSIPFEKIVSLMDHPYYSWFNLQVDDFKDDIKKWGMTDLITDCSEPILKEGFTRTGVIMLNLDLVITVDTAVAHLAGTLGIPVWMMVTQNSYWVWGRHGKKTPWYPSMSIFRQKEPGNWDSVIEDVHKQLDRARIELTSGKR